MFFLLHRFLFDEACADYQYYEYRLSEEEKALQQSGDSQKSQSGWWLNYISLVGLWTSIVTLGVITDVEEINIFICPWSLLICGDQSISLLNKLRSLQYQIMYSTGRAASFTVEARVEVFTIYGKHTYKIVSNYTSSLEACSKLVICTLMRSM